MARLSELDLHRSVADFFDWMLLPPAVWTTFPAGWTAMGRGAAGRLRGCGLKAGMPDVLVFHNGSTIGIELKTPSTSATKIQNAMHDRLRRAGVLVYICRSLEDVYEVMVTHKVPMRKFAIFTASK